MIMVTFNLMTKKKVNWTVPFMWTTGAYTVTDDKIIKSPFNQNNVAAINSKLNSQKDLITRACRIGSMVPM